MMSDPPRPPPSSQQQYIEVPVEQRARSLNMGTLLLIGGLGYVLVRTFLMEERINDLAILVKRQSTSSISTKMRPVPSRPPQRPNEKYETSSEEEEEEERTEEEEEESDDDDVRIEEQPRPQDPPHSPHYTPQERIEEGTPPQPTGSAFVTTRQRRAGSELRRNIRPSGE